MVSRLFIVALTFGFSLRGAPIALESAPLSSTPSVDNIRIIELLEVLQTGDPDEATDYAELYNLLFERITRSLRIKLAVTAAQEFAEDFVVGLERHRALHLIWSGRIVCILQIVNQIFAFCKPSCGRIRRPQRTRTRGRSGRLQSPRGSSQG